MKARMAFGAAALAAGLLASGGVARAQDNTSELEKYKQRTEALEKKVEQLEGTVQANKTSMEDQIQSVVKRMGSGEMKPLDFNVFWKDGVVFQTTDQAFTIHFGGRLQYDAAWMRENGDIRMYTIPTTGKSIGDQMDGTEVRRARLQADGTLYKDTFFKLEFDFAGTEKDKDGNVYGTSTVILKDAFVGFKNLVPYAILQVGHFKEPFGLEELTSDLYITFMERALPFAFVPDYNAGVQLSNAVLKERATWAVGVFRDTNDRGFSQSEGGYNVTARVTGLPWYQDNGRRLLHLGAGMSYRTPEPTVQYSARPEMHLASTYVDTGKITADNVILCDGEAALVLGPFSVQSEVSQARVRGPGGASNRFWGGYAQASYFLTGENRAYKTSSGVFDRVRPKNNFGVKKDGGRGWGAWELAARYSWLDLNDGGIRGGKLQDATVGLNWYVNPNVRVAANYVRALLADNGSQNGGIANMLGMRFQVDF